MKEDLGIILEHAFTNEVIVEAIVICQLGVEGREEVTALSNGNEGLGFVGVIGRCEGRG